MSSVAVSDPVLCGHGWPAVMSEISEEFTGIWGLGVFIQFSRSQTIFTLDISLGLRNKFLRETADFKCWITSKLLTGNYFKISVCGYVIFRCANSQKMHSGRIPLIQSSHVRISLNLSICIYRFVNV